MIKVENLSFGYIKQPLCLNMVNLTLNNGDRTLFIGGEGMGKTSLLKVMCGLEKQYVGNVLFDNVNISDVQNENKNISFLPSDPVLLNGSIKKNLEYLFLVKKISLSDDEVYEIFKLFNFNYNLNFKVKKLSLSNKRIFAMIRAYIVNSKYLFLDDQFEGVDSLSFEPIEHALRLLMNKNSAQKIVVCVSNCCNNSIINLFNKFYYFSFSKVQNIKQIEDLYFNPIDYYAKNYVLFKEYDMLIKNINNNYYLCFYDEVVDKKRKIINLNIKNMVKLSKNNVNLTNLNLNSEEYIKVKILTKLNLNEISDQEINNEINKSVFIFDEGTKVKIV